MLTIRETKKIPTDIVNSFYRRFGWISNGDIKVKVQYEAQRGIKSGLPLSFVRIKIAEPTKKDHDSSVMNLTTICDLITRNTRKYDIKFVIDEYSIGVILVETSIAGAAVYRDRMEHIFAENGFQNKIMIHAFAFEDMYDRIIQHNHE